MTKQIVDLRSDTVTRPCTGMMRAIQNAALGDDVYGEDPTVVALQQKAAQMTGHEAALFFPSGTQSNLVALLCHCQRADEYIVAQDAHTYKFEGGGAAALGGIQPQPLQRNSDGTLDLDLVETTIKADDIHFAKTRLLALENTTTKGIAIEVDYFAHAADLCAKHGLLMHLDGARIFNAATELDIDASEITEKFDTVSVCLSKGLGAPAGSVLCGSKAFIQQAIRWRKTVGGGMRQSGILAAAGLYALENNIERLKHDHELAAYLCSQLLQFDDIEIVNNRANTNMVFFNLKSGEYDRFYEYCEHNGVLFGDRNPVRMVTHKDVSKKDIDYAIIRLGEYFGV